MNILMIPYFKSAFQLETYIEAGLNFNSKELLPCSSRINLEDGATAKFFKAPSNACCSFKCSNEFCLIPSNWIKVIDVPFETSSVQCVSLHAKFPIASAAQVSSSGSLFPAADSQARNVSRYEAYSLFSYICLMLSSLDKIRTKRLQPLVRCS